MYGMHMCSCTIDDRTVNGACSKVASPTLILLTITLSCSVSVRLNGSTPMFYGNDTTVQFKSSMSAVPEFEYQYFPNRWYGNILLQLDLMCDDRWMHGIDDGRTFNWKSEWCWQYGYVVGSTRTHCWNEKSGKPYRLLFHLTSMHSILHMCII